MVLINTLHNIHKQTQHMNKKYKIIQLKLEKEKPCDTGKKIASNVDTLC